MNENLKEMTMKQLLFNYKRLARSAPSTFYATNKEMDAYYEEIFKLEDEIIKRTK